MAADFHLDPEADDQKLLAQVAGYYHARLKKCPEAIASLKARGVTGEAIKHFRIGFADRTLGKLLPGKQRKAGRVIRNRLEALGLFRADSGHEHFNGCVVFPVHAPDGTGCIVDLYGRKLGKRLRAGTLLDLHLGDERLGVWNVEGLADQEVILCNSVFDALSFWCHGFRSVTTTFADDVPSDDHLAALAEFNVKRVLVVSETAVPRLLAAGIDCFHLLVPNGASVEGFVRQADDPDEALAELLQSARRLGDGQTIPTTTSVPVESALPTSVPEPVSVPVRVVEAVQLCEDKVDEPPAPVETATEVEAAVDGDQVHFNFGGRRYRVRGWQKNLSFDTLKVNLLATNDAGLFVDTFDLYNARQRRTFVVQAAVELGVEERVVKEDVGRVLLRLEELQEQQVAATLQPKEPTPLMTDAEKEAALALLRDPHLLDRIRGDFDIVGEEANKLVGYLAAITRKLDEPLAVVIQSSSAAGKSALMDAVLALVPPEDLVKYSAMTGQSLFYMGETNLKHKILAIVEEEGARRAGYALKLLQSEGELMIATTGRESSTGRMVTQEYRVRGPVMIFLTTTSVTVDEELLNRSLVLTVNEDREQTKAIHNAQRRRQTLAGMLARQDRSQTVALHRNAQRLLRPLLVANPFAEQLTFRDDQTRTRRDHAKYLTLIQAVALLHQYQRPIKTTEHQGKQVEYVEVTPADIETANRLAHEVLGRCLDELPPQTRFLLGLIDDMVTNACQRNGLDRADYRFSRRDVREHTGWGHTQLAIHLKRLEALEVLVVHKGSQGRRFVYELVYQAPQQETHRFLNGLSDASHLSNFPGQDANLPAPFRVISGPLPGHFRPSNIDATSDVESNRLSAEEPRQHAQRNGKI